MSKKVTQLATQYKPEHYELTLDIDKPALQFQGEATITGRKISRPSKRITLHQKELKITAATITKIDKKNNETDVPVSRIMHHKSYDEVRLHTDEMLYPGRYRIYVTYQGKITEPMNGLYPCHFKHDDSDKTLLATQFESHHAREVFPCIDEPAAKATFQLTTQTTTDETILSNTPVQAQRKDGDIQVTTFEKTPVMSTYLLALAIGEVGYKEAITKHGVTIRAYATPDNVEYVQFALEVAVGCLEFYTEYFDIAYPLNKCDMIALPDFASGAMENWGLITYREQTLLVDPEHSTLSTKQYVAMVVAHELAHQWFGNLVTMQWWTDLWLNEGFASWIEYMAVDKLFPEWEMWTQFIASEQQQALRLDTLQNTHPVEVPIKHPDEIRTIFDAISYSKGASLIHMLHDYLGADDFRAGLQHYLRKHSYKNTTTNDLWQALEDSSKKPVKSFMNQWTTQSGYPLVQLDDNGSTTTITQQLLTTNPALSESSDMVWPVPLLSPHINQQALTDKSVSLQDSLPLDKKINQGQSGFYRVRYSAERMSRLSNSIEKQTIAPVDRIGLIADAFEAAKYGYGDSIEATKLLDALPAEDNYAVWEIISGWLGSMKLVMDSEELRDELKPYTRSLVKQQLERLGWDKRGDDRHFDRLLRPIIINMAANAEEQWVVDKCHNLFNAIHGVDDIRNDLRSIPSRKELKRGLVDPDLRGAVFGTVARRGDQATFDALVHLHHTSHLTEEKTTLAAAITAFKQPEIIEQALAMITSEHVRLQDATYWIAYSLMNRHAKEKTWQWLKDNWQWLDEKLGTDLSFYRMPLYVARVFSREDIRQDYEQFFSAHMTAGLERSYKQGVEMLDWQTRWRERDGERLRKHFQAKSRQ